MSKKHFLILFTILLAMFLLSPIFVFAQESKSIFDAGEPPKLQMPIPGTVEFSKIKVEGGTISVPWLAEYIAGIYKYAIALAVTLAIFMVMVGGFLWITAAGDKGKIGKATEIITDAVVGLILAVGSYVILYTINPDIINFNALRLKLVETQPLTEAAPNEFDTGQNESSSAPSTIPTSSEDCKEVARRVQSGEISFAKENDKAGFLNNNGIIKRNSCVWCYAPKGTKAINDTSENGPCGGESTNVATNPKVCKLILKLADAKKANLFKGSFSVRCIICGHTRCARTEGTPACTTCKQTATPGGKAKGQSNHWKGGGIDLPPNEDMQKYIVDNLIGLGIAQVIGPAGWDHTSINCQGTRTGKAQSPYLCNNGKCGVGYGAQTLCGHINHIHVGFE